MMSRIQEKIVRFPAILLAAALSLCAQQDMSMPGHDMSKMPGHDMSKMPGHDMSNMPGMVSQRV